MKIDLSKSELYLILRALQLYRKIMNFLGFQEQEKLSRELWERLLRFYD